jgi:hypothetical protein
MGNGICPCVPGSVGVVTCPSGGRAGGVGVTVGVGSGLAAGGVSVVAAGTGTVAAGAGTTGGGPGAGVGTGAGVGGTGTGAAAATGVTGGAAAPGSPELPASDRKNVGSSRKGLDSRPTKSRSVALDLRSSVAPVASPRA